MAEDLARPLVDGLGVPAALGLGAWFVAKSFEETGSDYTAAPLGPGGIITLSSIGFLVFMQELAGLSAPLGFSAIGNPMSPEQGDYFTEGAYQSAGVAPLLQRAVSVNWQGEAAFSYDAACVTLSVQAQKLASNDAAMANLVDAQANNVSQTQFNLGMFQDSLLLVYIAVWILERTGESGFIWCAYMLALVACPPFVAAGLGELSNCLENSVDLADQASDIDYSTAATAARKVTADCVAALSGLAAQPPAPPAPSTPAWTGDAALQRIASSAPPDPASGVAADPLQPAALPDRDRPFMPAPPVLGAAQVIAPPGQSAHLPGSFTPPGEQAGRPARPAVRAQPAGIREVEDLEARPADSASERVPLDVAAVGAESAPPQAVQAGLQS